MLYPKDPHVKVVEQDGTLRITWGWPWRLGVALATIGALLALVSVPMSREPLGNGEPRSIGDVIAILLIVGGLGLSLFVGGLALILNRSTIQANSERLTYLARPIALNRPRTYDMRGVRQFYVPIRLTAEQSSSSSRSGVGLYVILADDTAHLITATFRSKIALYQVQRELQEFYGLEDLPVYGQTALTREASGPK